MVTLKLLGLLLSVAAISTDASSFARVHWKFVQPPHVQEHGITTDGNQVIAQQSYLSVGRRVLPNFGAATPRSLGYYPQRYSQPRYISQRPILLPVESNDLNVGTREYNHVTPDFSNGLDYPDPLLLTGEEALLAVKYLYGRGELFFHDVPHVRALLKNQEERRENGLHGNILRSLRPSSPWYRKND